MGKLKLAGLLGRLQRQGVDVFFGYGEQQDLKDATKQIATIGQGGLGLPEKDYYLRTGEKDQALRDKYVAHVAKMLVLAGGSPALADHEAHSILALETALAKASLGVVDLRDPEKTYHLQPVGQFEANLPKVNFGAFEDAIHSPHVRDQQLHAGVLAGAAAAGEGRGHGDAEGLSDVPPAHGRCEPPPEPVR